MGHRSINPAIFEKTQKGSDLRFLEVCGFYPRNSRKAADSLKCEMRYPASRVSQSDMTICLENLGQDPLTRR